MNRFFNTRKIAGVVTVLAIVLFVAAPQALAAEYWLKIYERFSATAGETLAVGDAVCIKASDSKAYKADANDANLRPAIGVIGKGGASAATVEIVVRGVKVRFLKLSEQERKMIQETIALRLDAKALA